jgi:outer membrane protein W
VAEVDVNPVTFAANFHIIPDNVIDFYVGPVASYVSFDADDADIDSEATFGAAAGLDIGIGEHFAVTGGVRWLDLSAEDDTGLEVSIDPLFLRAGVAWRF